MDDLLDMIIADESPSQISDKIKDILFAKSAEKIQALKPEVASRVFDDETLEVEDELEVNAEYEVGDELEYEDEEEYEEEE